MSKRSNSKVNNRVAAQAALKGFEQVFKRPAKICAFAPGRAEIIGNHTDYNNGFALAAALACGIGCAAAVNSESVDAAPQVRVYSSNFSSDGIVSFKICDQIAPAENASHWSNYIRGVAQHMAQNGAKLKSVDLFLASDLPLSGGVASSAALEIVSMLAICSANDLSIPDPLELALACQQVENTYMHSPCGILDQGTITFGREQHFVLFDFQPQAHLPFTSVRTISSSLLGEDVCFVIVLDPTVKRQLGSSGYPARRRACEQSLPILGNLLGRQLTSLRQVSANELSGVAAKLRAHDPTIERRVQHVVSENERVLASVEALRTGNANYFGSILTQSGHSALELYELDEDTPELTKLVQTGRSLDGVLGFRNMGGGFSANALALVQRSALDKFKQQLSSDYSQSFKGQLQFIEFTPSNGAQVSHQG